MCGHFVELQDEDGLDIIGPNPIRAGDVALFEWKIENMDYGRNGTIVQCWTGRAWADAWGATGILGSPGPPGFVLDIDRFEFTPEPRAETSGGIAIPPFAPPGSYRFVLQAEICEAADEESCVGVKANATFDVLA